MGEGLSRKLSDRFELRRIGELRDVYVIEHGPVEWLSFPTSHLSDLHKIVQRELLNRLDDEDGA